MLFADVGIVSGKGSVSVNAQFSWADQTTTTVTAATTTAFGDTINVPPGKCYKLWAQVSCPHLGSTRSFS